MSKSIQQTVAHIIQALGETERGPINKIWLIVRHAGPEQALAWLQETQQIEANGGMMALDGSRRRTIGGVFFYLVRGKLNDTDRRAIFPPRRTYAPPQSRRGSAPPQAPATAPDEPTLPPLTEAERVPLIRELRRESGKATSVKITLIGRPGRVVEKKDLVLTTMQNDKVPAFPKGLPAPPSAPTSYTVYISAKQWKGIATAIENPEDALVLEGWAAYDPELEGIAVWVTTCTTKLLQRAKREAQQQPQQQPQQQQQQPQQTSS